MLTVDMGWGDWRIADSPTTRLTQAQADYLNTLDAGAEGAGSSDVRFGEEVGDVIVILADGRWIEVAVDGSTEDVTTEVMG